MTAMDRIASIPGKLLLLTYTLHQQNAINIRDRGILKDLILGNSKQIANAYQAYEREGTELTLRSALLHILRNQKEAQTEEGLSERSHKTKGRALSIKVPKKNIQKLPAEMDRL